MRPLLKNLLRASAAPLRWLLPVALIAAGSLAAAQAPSGGAPGGSAPAKVSTAEGLAAFETVRAVLQHPRCQNCHIPGDAPLQFDQGLAHSLNVQRGPEGSGVPGLPCSTCHSVANPPASYGAHLPPGAPNWKLPPPQHKMVFIGAKSGALCRTLKDQKQNGGKDLAALVHHVSADALVLWGWKPGVGRKPVDIPHATFVAKFEQWVAAGAPCPPSPP